jgi:hypothetical protein
MPSTPAPAAVALINKLKSLTSELEKGADVTTINEALGLSRQLTGALSRPEDVAAELIFTVGSSPASLASFVLGLMEVGSRSFRSRPRSPWR